MGGTTRIDMSAKECTKRGCGVEGASCPVLPPLAPVTSLWLATRTTLTTPLPKAPTDRTPATLPNPNRTARQQRLYDEAKDYT